MGVTLVFYKMYYLKYAVFLEFVFFANKILCVFFRRGIARNIQYSPFTKYIAQKYGKYATFPEGVLQRYIISIQIFQKLYYLEIWTLYIFSRKRILQKNMKFLKKLYSPEIWVIYIFSGCIFRKYGQYLAFLDSVQGYGPYSAFR